MRIKSILAGIVSAFFIASAAHSATVKINFSATIDYITGLSNSPIAMGQKISATVFIDESQSAISANSVVNNYWFSSGSVSNLSLGTTSVLNALPPGFPSLQVNKSGFNFNSAGPNSIFGFGITGGLAAQAAPYTLTQMISDLLVPNRQLVGNNFISFMYSGVGAWGSCTGPCDVYAKIDKIDVTRIAAVPVPAALPLMLLGLTGLGLMGRRKRAQT